MALSDQTLAIAVARHKSMFFREKDWSGIWIDYHEAVSGGLQLIPEREMYRVLGEDYESMMSDGLLLDDERYDQLMDRCSDIEGRANKRGN